MKRSEAIEKLISIVYNHSYMDMILEKDEADNILKDIEEQLGMLPPARMRYVECENGNTLCSEDCSWDEE